MNQHIKRGLIYQTAEYANVCFVATDKKFYELRGTNSDPNRKFHMSVGLLPNRSFFFTGDGRQRPERVCICESSLDADSLYAMLRDPGAMYVGIGGAGKQQSIDLMKLAASKTEIPAIIAVDNDKAGDGRRTRFLGRFHGRDKGHGKHIRHISAEATWKLTQAERTDGRKETYFCKASSTFSIIGCGGWNFEGCPRTG